MRVFAPPPVDAPAVEQGGHGSGRPLFIRCDLATRSDDREDVKEANRKLRNALQDCQEMLAKAQEALRRSKQDNERSFSD